MKRIIEVVLFFVISFLPNEISAAKLCNCEEYVTGSQDSVRLRQILYNGQIWRNSYFRIDGDPYFLNSQFIKGTISISGHIFTGIELKYDISSDQLIIAKDNNQIIQVNKEMVDYFSIPAAEKEYRFVKVSGDSLNFFSGYMNELYLGGTSLYVKYFKDIFKFITGEFMGEFRQEHRIFIVRNDTVSQIKNLKDVCRVLETDKSEMKSFMKKNRLKVSAKYPDSFVPLLEHFDNIQAK